MNRLPGELQGGGTVTVLGVTVPVMNQGAAVSPGPVDVLVRPEGLTMAAAEGGNGIVTTRTFLGAVTRVGVLLSGDHGAGRLGAPRPPRWPRAPRSRWACPDPVLVAPRK